MCITKVLVEGRHALPYYRENLSSAVVEKWNFRVLMLAKDYTSYFLFPPKSTFIGKDCSIWTSRRNFIIILEKMNVFWCPVSVQFLQVKTLEIWCLALYLRWVQDTSFGFKTYIHFLFYWLSFFFSQLVLWLSSLNDFFRTMLISYSLPPNISP